MRMTRLALSTWCDYLHSSSARPPPSHVEADGPPTASLIGRFLSLRTSCVNVYTVTKAITMKRRFSAINETAAPAPTRPRTKVDDHGSDTEVTDVEEHSALEVELDRGDEKLDSLKFIKKDRLRWLTQASSADTIIQALGKCGLGEGDALSRKRRRFQRARATAPCSAKALGKRRRAAVVSTAWREDRHDPLTKLRVFKDMKKGKAVARGSDVSVSDVEDEVDEVDERMELSDIEWYTRQAVDGDEWDEDDDLDMSEVELGVMASPRRLSPEAEPYKPVVSFAEVNNVPVCLYRPIADIIEEVYLHLGLGTADQRGFKLLHDQLSGKLLRTGKELGSVGVFPTRPLAAKDWAALKLSRKIMRRDRLAKCAIYRFTFNYPKESVPSRFLRWQTWNHPTLDELRKGVKLKLDERGILPMPVPSSPAVIEAELDDEVESCVDDLLSELDVDESIASDESDETLEETEVEDGDEDESEVEEDEVEPSELDEAPATPRRAMEVAEENEVLCEALGLSEPRRIAPLPRTPIYSRLPRSLNDSPPSYTERMYRDRSPTPPPPFNAQTDNTVVIPPRFSPQSIAPVGLPRLLPPFSITPSRSPRRPQSRVMTEPRPRNTSGEIIMPGSYARPAPAAAAPAPTTIREVNTFDLALDMEEAETELELATLTEVEETQPEAGLVSWGTNLVRSWWSR